MDISNGKIEIANDLLVTPEFTFENFKKSRFYNNQDGIRIIYLDGQQIIDSRKYLVSLFFRNGKIYMLSLICCDIEYTEKEEQERKELHDKILLKYRVDRKKKFAWGEIESVYDARSNISSINIIYYVSA